MLTQPEQSPAQSKIFDPKPFRDYFYQCHSHDTPQFLHALRQAEKADLDRMKGKPVEETASRLTKSDHEKINNLIGYIQSPGNGDTVRDYILAQAIHTNQYDLNHYFYGLRDVFIGKPTITLVRMLAELELLGTPSDIPQFNDESSWRLDDRVPMPNEEILKQIPTTPPTVDDTTIYTPTITRYIVENEKDDEGGFSDVIKAWDTRLQKLVCIKRLNNRISKYAEYKNLMELEAKSMGRLSHPGIPEIYDFIVQDGTPYMIMQYIKGTNLGKRLKHGQPIHKDELIQIISQAARAIDYVSDFNKKEPLIHGDIKPSNFIVADDGRIYLIDFGLANWVFDPQLGIPYSLGFRAPEILNGEKQTKKSDIFSFAATIYNLLTNDFPYSGEDTDEFVQSVSQQEFIPIRKEMCKGISLSDSQISEINEILKKGAAFDPQERYETAEVCAQAVVQALSHTISIVSTQ